MKTKIALITGSSNGIGAGIAKHLAKNGYTVIITYFINKKDGENVVKTITSNGGQALLSKLDVMSETSVKATINLINKRFGKLDVLVNNAAVAYITSIENANFEDWKTITRTKIDGNFLCTKYAFPLLKKSDNPNLVIIASSMGERPNPEDYAYCVGTAGTICFMKAMSLALAKYKIRTNAICPGETRTNMWKDFGDTDEMWTNFAKKNPLGRVCTPEDIGKAVLMIVEDKTRFLNGNIIYVNGGGHLK